MGKACKYCGFEFNDERDANKCEHDCLDLIEYDEKDGDKE